MQSGNIEQYKQLSQFRDLKDFNNHFEQWMIDLKDKFTKSELIALKRLVRFSASIAGVCYAKIQTIVAATHEFDGVGISRSTFKRMLTKAKEVGLLVIHNTFRNGKQGHSVYVFNSYPPVCDQVEPPKKEKLNQHNKSINLSKSIKNKLRKDKPVFINHYVDESFASLASYYFNPDQINEMWKIGYINSKKYSLPSKDLIRLYVSSLKALISKMRANVCKKPMGYYTGIIRRRMKSEQVKSLFVSVFDQ
ncbi:hypothetical protein [Cytobacillus oceanisediminis]|uniref:hypothetical protein n=1 Tax=Cytobacillus oceanisediminis TaxID=665099 RepID=UPI0037351446